MTDHKILLFEAVHQKGLDHLTRNGCEIVYAEGFDPEQITRAVTDVDGILARAQGYIDGPCYGRRAETEGRGSPRDRRR